MMQKHINFSHHSLPCLTMPFLACSSMLSYGLTIVSMACVWRDSLSENQPHPRGWFQIFWLFCRSSKLLIYDPVCLLLSSVARYITSDRSAVTAYMCITSFPHRGAYFLPRHFQPGHPWVFILDWSTEMARMLLFWHFILLMPLCECMCIQSHSSLLIFFFS